MKKIIYALIVFTMVALCGPMEARAVAQLIDIQFLGVNGTQSGAAVIGAAGDTWNRYNGVAQQHLSLVNSANAATGVLLSYGAPNGWGSSKNAVTNTDNSFFSTDYRNLFSGYNGSQVGGVGTTTILTFSGLTAGDYDLIIYSQTGKNTTSTLNFTANGVTGSATTNGTLSTLTKGANYQDVIVHVTNSGILAISFNGTSEVNGIQLRGPGAVPEPATVVLLGFGGMLVAFRLRKSNAISEYAA